MGWCLDESRAVNVETGRGQVHGCLARRDGERERSMGSGQWAGCGMQEWSVGDSSCVFFAGDHGSFGS